MPSEDDKPGSKPASARCRLRGPFPPARVRAARRRSPGPPRSTRGRSSTGTRGGPSRARGPNSPRGPWLWSPLRRRSGWTPGRALRACARRRCGPGLPCARSDRGARPGSRGNKPRRPAPPSRPTRGTRPPRLPRRLRRSTPRSRRRGLRFGNPPGMRKASSRPPGRGSACHVRKLAIGTGSGVIGRMRRDFKRHGTNSPPNRCRDDDR